MAARILRTSGVEALGDLQDDKTEWGVRLLFIVFVTFSFVEPTFFQSNLVQDIWWGTSFSLALIGLLLRRKFAIELLFLSLPLVFLVLLACLSSFWSDDVFATLRRSFALVESATLATYFVCRLGFQAFLDAVGVALTFLAVVSVVLILLFPEIGVSQGAEGWQGCFVHKNELGQAMLLGLLTVSLQRTGRLPRLPWFFETGLFVVLLIGSKSGTCLVVAMTLAVLVPLMFLARNKFANRPRLVLALFMFFAIIFGAMVNLDGDAILEAFGKDTSLTGRTAVWDFTSDAIAQRPVLGYGYGAFWLTNGLNSQERKSEPGTWATQAHNGYIEVALDVGLLGLAAFGVFLIAGLKSALRAFWMGGDLRSAWPLLVIGSFMMINCFEAIMLTYYSVLWIVIAMAGLYATLMRLGRLKCS